VKSGAVGLAALLLLPGCVATQKDVLDLSEQTDQLKSQVGDLKKSIGSLQANQADLSVQIKQLHEDLTAYSETVKASQGDMGKLSAKLDELGSQLSGKVTQLGTAIGQAQKQSLEAQQRNSEALERQKRENAATELFVGSEKRLETKDYAEAAAGFEEYLKRFPGGSLDDVATYDLGLAYFGLKKWEKAGREFALVLDKYPKSGQTPGARLHYARCLLGLKKSRAEAKAYLESIVSDFPKAPEAKDAAAELKRLAAKK
jgi:tol-pal system protein YbgF